MTPLVFNGATSDVETEKLESHLRVLAASQRTELLNSHETIRNWCDTGHVETRVPWASSSNSTAILNVHFSDAWERLHSTCLSTKQISQRMLVPRSLSRHGGDRVRLVGVVTVDAVRPRVRRRQLVARARLHGRAHRRRVQGLRRARARGQGVQHALVSRSAENTSHSTCQSAVLFSDWHQNVFVRMQNQSFLRLLQGSGRAGGRSRRAR